MRITGLDSISTILFDSSQPLRTLFILLVVEMDDKSFQAAKKKIIGSWKKYKCLTDISAELEGYKNDPNVKEYGEKSWSFQDQDECCQEFGWPDVRSSTNSDFFLFIVTE